jgi:hypothetical protein
VQLPQLPQDAVQFFNLSKHLARVRGSSFMLLHLAHDEMPNKHGYFNAPVFLYSAQSGTHSQGQHESHHKVAVDRYSNSASDNETVLEPV